MHATAGNAAPKQSVQCTVEGAGCQCLPEPAPAASDRLPSACSCQPPAGSNLRTIAGCRWVSPGISTSTSASARSAAAAMSSRSAARIRCSWPYSHRRVSVATCAGEERFRGWEMRGQACGRGVRRVLDGSQCLLLNLHLLHVQVCAEAAPALSPSLPASCADSPGRCGCAPCAACRPRRRSAR